MDTVTIKLPVSGKEVEIRNYTTRADDARAEAVLYAGVAAKQKGGEEQEISFPLENVIGSQRSYIPRLVKSIDGDSTSISLRLGELRTADYEAIEEAVNKIIETNSPKAQEASSASTKSTPEK